MNPEIRWLAACGLLLGAGVGLVWSAGIIARPDRFDVFDEDDCLTPRPTTRRRGCIGSG